jgi:hypothetical protein
MIQRLEVECIPDGTYCDCTGNPVIDATGRHFWKCPKAIGAHMVAHNDNSNLYSIFKNAAGKLTKTKFPPPLGSIMNEDTYADTKRSGDIMEYKMGRPSIMYDNRTVTTRTAAVERGEIANAGAAAREGEILKHRMHDANCAVVNIVCVALITTDMAEWGIKMKRDFIETISAAADNKKINILFIENYWTKRIAIQLQRGLANKVILRKQQLMKGRVMEGDESVDISNVMIQTTANGSTGASSYDIR